MRFLSHKPPSLLAAYVVYWCHSIRLKKGSTTVKIKHIILVALAALALGLASIVPGVSDGQQGVSPAKDSATAWAVANEQPRPAASPITTMGSAAGGVIGSKAPRITTDGGKAGVNGGDVK